MCVYPLLPVVSALLTSLEPFGSFSGVPFIHAMGREKQENKRSEQQGDC